MTMKTGGIVGFVSLIILGLPERKEYDLPGEDFAT